MQRLRKPRECLVGRRFVRLTVSQYVPGKRGVTAKWRCACDCGRIVVVGTYSLLRGKTKSCGCYSLDMIAERNRIRTMSARGKPPEYAVWCTMKARCHQPKRKDFPRYGGRGIVVCERWKRSFDAFLSDMGARPSALHSLDRIDNDGPYSPDNCAWATLHEQANNRSNNYNLDVNGVVKSLTQWGRDVGLSAQCIRWRLSAGWAPDRAISERPRGRI